MKFIKYILFSVFALSFAACEDVIELDLGEAEQQTVVEAYIQTNTGICEVKLSKTRTFYEDNNFETIEDATVELTLADGSIVALSDENGGVYRAENLVIESGEDYRISIITKDGISYNAETTAPFFVPIDTLEIEEHPFPEDEDEDSYYVSCRVFDPINQTNFYRLKVTVNGVLDPYGYILRDDEIVIDNEIRLGSINEEVTAGDVVEIELISMDEASYDYFNLVSDISQENGGGNVVPFNPTGNFGSETLGYFGIFNSDYQTIIIP